MRNLLALLLIMLVGVIAGCNAPPQIEDQQPSVSIVQDGTEVLDVVISVDDLHGQDQLFASISAAPQYEIDDPPELIEGESLIDYIKRNWKWLLSVIILLSELIARLTPTEKDNTFITRVLVFVGKFIPNLKKGGGTHATPG